MTYGQWLIILPVVVVIAIYLYKKARGKVGVIRNKCRTLRDKDDCEITLLDIYAANGDIFRCVAKGHINELCVYDTLRFWPTHTVLQTLRTAKLRFNDDHTTSGYIEVRDYYEIKKYILIAKAPGKRCY